MTMRANAVRANAVQANAVQSNTVQSSGDEISLAWQSACAALASAERAGLPEAELERLADQVINSSLLLGRRRGARLLGDSRST